MASEASASTPFSSGSTAAAVVARQDRIPIWADSGGQVRVMRTDLDPKVECVQGKGALQARFLAMRSKDRWAPRQLAS